ncbi:lipopolysaccharide assembly protein LapA domain-containing protein [Pseudomonadota bacterium]
MNNQSHPHKYHLILGIIGVFSVVIFTLQNSEVVTVNFLFWRVEMSRVLLILVVLLIGFLLGYIFHGVRKK